MRVLLPLLAVLYMLTGDAHAQSGSTSYEEEALSRIESERLEQTGLLNLCCIELTELPPELWELVHLETLYLNDNNLDALPPEIGQLRNLRSLRIGGNNLTTLPPEIGQLQSLERLFAQQNDITRLPHPFRQLRSLTWLDLSENQLASLPPQFGSQHWLSTVWLNDNELTLLPLSTGEMSHYTDFDVTGNPLIVPPPEVAAGGVYAIDMYFRNPTGPTQVRYATLVMLAGLLAAVAACIRGAGVLLRHADAV